MTHPATAVLGLGRMGAALADRLAAGGVPLTVWNRNPARAYGFQDRARVARSAAEACAAAEVVLLSLSDYHAGIEVMEDVANEVDLSDKTLVQLTSGSPADARSMNAWTGMHGMQYLDAAIVAYPNAVGTSQAVLFYAGDEDRFEQLRPLLTLLGGGTRFVGEDIGAAATLDCALLCYYYGASAAMLQGAALCESEGYSLNDYFHTVNSLGPLLAATADGARNMIDREIYTGEDCTLDTHVAALRHIQRLAHDNGVDPRLPDALVATFRRAASGRGDEELAAVFEVLRRPDD